MSLEIVSSKTNFDFIGKRYFAFLLSALLIAGSAYVWFDKGDAKFSIDYSGGHEVVVKLPEGSSTDDVRVALKKAGVEGAIVQAFEAASFEYSIRFASDMKSKEIVDMVKSALVPQFKDQVEVIKQDFVGPTIGEELKRKAYIAIFVGLIGMLAYITWRFELAFAIGAVAALFHDVIITMGVYLYFDFSIGVATLAAALTIVGYSVNDTIIVFDRMREELVKNDKGKLVDIMNFSINATLSRTIITSLLTLFAALSLLIFGGGAIADLSLFLSVGVVCGTYSTIFIATPVALGWERVRSAVEKKQ